MTDVLLPFLKKHLLLIGIFCLGFFTYAPSLNNQLFWDDEQFIYNNQYVKQFDVQKIFTTNTLAGAGEVSNYYRPLTTLSFAFDHSIWGLRPFGFHLTNTVLHSAAGVLLFLLLTILGMRKKPAAVIAAFFLIHPLQTEAVVYANSRGDSLYTLYMLLGLLSFRYLLQNRKVTLTLYNLSYTFDKKFFAVTTLCMFVASVLAKEIALGSVTLYLLIFLYSYKEVTVKKTFKAGLLVISGIASLLALYGILRATVLHFQEQINMFAGTLYGDSVLIRIATFAKVLLIYISLIFAPLNLHMERTTDIVASIFSPYVLASMLLITGLFFLGNKEYKQTRTRWIHLGLAWFLGMLLPVSGIVPINDIMYEHWLYVPIIGFFILLYGCIKLVLSTLQRPWPTFTNKLLLILGTIYIVLTIRQNYIWAKSTRFYPYILQFHQTARIHNNLAMAYADEKRYSEAITHYKQAIETNNFYPQTHHNLARSYMATGETQKAIEAFTTAITMNPNFLVSYPELIQLLLKEGEVDIAEVHLVKFENELPNSVISRQLRVLLELTKKNLQVKSETSD